MHTPAKPPPTITASKSAISDLPLLQSHRSTGQRSVVGTCDSDETRSVQIVTAARVVDRALLEALVEFGRHGLRVGQLGAPRIPGLAKGLCAGAMADPEDRGEIVALHRLGDLRPVSVALAPLLVEVVLDRHVGRRGALLLQLDLNHVEVLGARAERGRQNGKHQKLSHRGSSLAWN